MLLPLDMLTAGELAEVCEVGGEPGWVGRLAELGLREGCRVRVLQAGSPCVLEIANCKLGVRACECSQILVRPVGS